MLLGLGLVDAARTRRSVADYAEELRALLIDAVRLQARGCAGGRPSQQRTRFLRDHEPDQKLYRDPAADVFGGLQDAEFDEAHYQRELVHYLRTEHSSFLCRREDIGAAFPRAVLHAESAFCAPPPRRSCCSPTACARRVTRWY